MGVILLIPIGSQVEVKLSKIRGIVTGINIRAKNKICYEVSYMLEGEHKTPWLEECEITIVTNKNFKKIGFLKNL